MTKSRDIAKILGVTEANNPNSSRILFLDESLDSARITTIADTTSPSLTVYDSINELPVQSLVSGAQAYVKSNKRLYVTLDNAYYNIATVNLTPTITLDPSGTIVLSDSGQPSAIVTMIATDSDGRDADLTFSVESDGNMLGRATLTQDSSVFTIDPLTADSGATTGTFTLTFKANDGINIGTATKEFSLTFAATTVDSSSATVLLMKASGSGKAHEGISYQYDTSPTTDLVGFTTTTGTPVASSFSPYREGGYSYYGDGTGDRIDVTSSSAMNLGTGNFCIEMWVYSDDWTANIANNGLMSKRNNSGSEFKYIVMYVNASKQLFVSISSNGSSWDILNQANTTTTLNNAQWNHIALVRNGTDFTTYINGVGTSQATSSSSVQFPTDDLNIGAIGKSGSYQYNLKGYIRDFRMVKGDAVYTSNFTPPTESLTAITNTSLLTCHLPYFADGSSSGHSITVNGNSHTAPFGPYDYNAFTLQTDVGSTFLTTGVDGMAETTNHQTISNFGSGNFTIEMWYYPTGLANYQTLYTGRANTATYGQLTLFVNSAGSLLSYASSTGSSWDVVAEAGTTIKVINKTWNHIAYVRNGNTWTIYVNGVGEVVSTNSGTLVANTLLQIGYENTNTNSQASGYISDYRIVKGTAVYTADFTPPTEKLTWITNTTLQLQNTYDTYVYDASASMRLNLINDAQSSTAQRKFSTSSSLILDGTDIAYVDPEDLRTADFLSGPWTIEFWLYPTNWYNNGGVFTIGWQSGTYGPFVIYTGTGTNWLLYASSNGSSWNLGAAWDTYIARWTNSWKHVAMTWDTDGSFTMWLDGSASRSGTGLTNLKDNPLNSTSRFAIGGAQSGSANYGFPGYVQDLRLSRKIRYTGTFTPPTAEFEL